MTDDELQAFIEGLEWQQENASGVTLEEHELPTVLQALRQMRDQRWRTIDNAPKGGEEFLTYANGNKSAVYERDKFQTIVISKWKNGVLWRNRPDNMPTHWMPLPQPPEDAK